MISLLPRNVAGYGRSGDLIPALRQRSITLSREEFETLYHRIINIIKYESLHSKDLLLKLNGIKKEKAWKVIEFLQSENAITVDAKGIVMLR